MSIYTLVPNNFLKVVLGGELQKAVSLSLYHECSRVLKIWDKVFSCATARWMMAYATCEWRRQLEEGEETTGGVKM